MKYLKYYLFLFIFLLVPNCYAQEINANQYVSAEFNGTKNKYVGVNWENGQSSYYNIGTKYNGKLSGMTFYIHYPFEEGYTITITMNMADADWRNNFSTVYVYGCRAANDCDYVNYSNGTISFVSMYKIKFTFTPTENMADVRVSFLSKQGAMGNITGDTNFTLSSILLNDPFYDTPSSGGGSSGGGSSGSTPTNQDIINNATGNTNKIIDNQNQNTQDILENNNQNTQSLIDNQNNMSLTEVNNSRANSTTQCKNVLNFSFSKGKRINSNDTLIDDEDSYYTADYVRLPSSASIISITGSNISNTPGYYLIIYDSSYNIVDYTYANNRNYTLPTGAYYFKISTTYSTLNLFNGSGGCKTATDELNSSINNDNVDSGTGSDFFNNFNTTDNGGISGIITKPLVLINSLLSNNNSCSDLTFSIQFPALSSKSVSLPSGCILWDKVPSSVVNLYQVFVVGFSSYYLLKRLFKDVEDLKNPDKDEVEVIDL